MEGVTLLEKAGQGFQFSNRRGFNAGTFERQWMFVM